MKKSLLLTLQGDAKVWVSDQELTYTPLWAEGSLYHGPRATPWTGFFDVLYQRAEKVFCGVSFEVPRMQQRFVRGVCKWLNPAIVLYNDGRHPNGFHGYPATRGILPRVEIYWAGVRPDAYELAHVETSVWYYKDQAPPKWSIRNLFPSSARNLSMFGIAALDTVLEEFGLTFPSMLPFPTFEPKFEREIQ